MRLSTSAWIPLPRDRVFAFFADAANLQTLTPVWLHFRILTPMPLVMREGALIDYRIRIHGIPVGWRSEITVWQPIERFVDEQRRGPYRRWRHAHTFEDADGGTTVGDNVEFEVPGGLLPTWLVSRDLRKIFAYRHGALADALGVPRPSRTPAITIATA